MVQHLGQEREADSASHDGVLLMVANYEPDVGFAWWLMEHFWIQLASIARERGLHPVIVYPVAGALPVSIREAAIETRVMPFPGRGLRERLTALKFVRRRKVRFVYMTDRGFTSLFYAPLRAAGVRGIVTHEHTPGDRPPVEGLRGKLKSLMRRMPTVNADLQVCVSPLIGERSIVNQRIPRHRIRVVQNGIEPIGRSGDRLYAHRKLGLDPGTRICITVGRANPYKRIDFVIEVARHVVHLLAIPNVVFVHCGDGPDIGRLQGLVRRNKLGGRFLFAGRRDDVRALLASAEIALHASRGEAFSLAIVEYMSAGLAVLVPDIPSVRQAIQHGHTGLVYTDGDANSAAKLISELLQSESLVRRLGTAAMAEVESRYSMSSMDRQFREVLVEALNGSLQA